jgi:hypothetical protein
MWLYNKVMNWVSRHILLAPFMCLFLLFACGSSHKAVKSNTEIIMKDSTRESVNIVHDGSSISLSELITTNGNYVIDFRIYDTRKPPDSLTGKPPLLADGQIEGSFNQAKDKKTVITDAIKLKTDKKCSSNIHEKGHTETTKDKRKSNLLEQIVLACVSVAILVVIVLTAVRRQRGNDFL